MKKLILTLALVAMGSVAHAQVAQNATASAVVQAPIEITKNSDLVFGDVFPGNSYTIAPTAGGAARFDVVGQSGADVTMTFTALPSELTGPGTALAITYTNALIIDDDTTPSDTPQTPVVNTGISATLTGGAQYVYLGGTLTTIPNNQTAGTYSAIVTLSVAYN